MNSSYLDCDYSPELIATVKQKVLEALDDSMKTGNAGKYVHSILDDTTLLKRYMRRRRGALEPCVQLMLDVFRWRVQNDFCFLSLERFPGELLARDAIFLFGPNQDGDLVVCIRLAAGAGKQTILHQLAERMLVSYLDQIDQIAARERIRWSVVIDCNGCGMGNIDLETGRFLIATLNRYMPAGQNLMYVLNLPWILSALKTVLLSLVPQRYQRQVKFVNTSQLLQQFGKNCVPLHMGGTGRLMENNFYKMCQSRRISTVDPIRLSDQQRQCIQKLPTLPSIHVN